MQDVSFLKPYKRISSSISRRFSFALIGVVTILLIGFAVVGIFFNVTMMEKELKTRLDNVMKLARISLPTPLWNLNNEVVNDFIEALFLDESIVYAKVSWGREVISEKNRPRFGLNLSESDMPSSTSAGSDFIFKSSDIYFEKTNVGKILIVMSCKSVRNQVFLLVYGIIALTVLIISAIWLTSIIITKRYISRPLYKLQEAASAISHGDLDTFVDISGSDEIGMLARHLDDMRDSIKRLFEELNKSKEKLEETNRTLEENVELRTQELAKSVDELKALSDVSQAVNSTLDLHTVLNKIVAYAVRLSGTEAGAIYEFDETTEEFQLRATYRMSEELLQAIKNFRIKLGETVVGQTRVKSKPVQIHDILEQPDYPLRNALQRAGFRALLGVPLLRENKIIGSLVVRRREPGAFKQETVDFLQNFASQSALAIQNARLFLEIEKKGLELEIASRHKSEFLANMSHELRTPLNAILGYTELILDKIYGDVPDKIQEILERLEQNGRHLLGLINNVLDISKIEAGRLTLSLCDYSMRDVVQTVFTSAEALAAEKNLTLKIHMPEDLPFGRGDEQRISQVLMNLIGNAIKFTERGEIRLDVAVSDDDFLVSVTDTGPGLSEEDKGKIFDEFQQADSSSTREKEGTGLGLSIAKRIIEMHGGSIWVDSTIAKGSVFRFRLPVRVEMQRD